MTRAILVIKDNDLYVGTWEISKGFKVDHRSIKELIKKFRVDFEDVGECVIETRPIIAILNGDNSSPKKPKKRERGRPVEEYLLNEPQATFLTTLLRNNDMVRKFKKHLTKEFYRQRRLLARLMVRKQNAEWLQKRAEGKIERRVETDTIKEFIEYAIKQGSKNATKYYIAISKMENQTLFNLEFIEQRFPNLRDMLNGMALDMLKMADYAVTLALREGMENNLFYKDIYISAKERIEGLSIALGKPPLEKCILNDSLLLRRPMQIT